MANSPRRPGAALEKKRVTEGRYVDNGEKFIVADEWTDKRTAHRVLEREWIGSTTFECTSRTSHGASHDGSIGGRLSDVDEAAGPPELKEEDHHGGGVTPKPDHMQDVWVRREAGEVAEIDIASHGRHDDEWDLLAVDEEYEDPELEGPEATRYRAITARLNYVCSDRVDTQYATKEAARHMSSPCQSHMGLLKRIGKMSRGKSKSVMNEKKTRFEIE